MQKVLQGYKEISMVKGKLLRSKVFFLELQAQPQRKRLVKNGSSFLCNIAKESFKDSQKLVGRVFQIIQLNFLVHH